MERRAGTADGSVRYSDALKQLGLVRDKRNLDAWLENPAVLVSGNAMISPGTVNARTRVGPVACIEAVSTGRVKVSNRGLPDLKESNTASRTVSIRFCGDTYRPTVADRKAHVFWGLNLHFKTDGSVVGPAADQPVLIGMGMQGDYAAVVLVRLEEVPAFTQRRHP